MNPLRWICDQIFPENLTCELCGRELFDGGRLCEDCARTVTPNDGVTCPKCGRKTKTEALCLECKALAPKYEKAVSALVYDDGGRTLVNLFKNGKAYLKDYFSAPMAEKCAKFTDAQAICFVPMTARDKRARGYNQAELLAKSLGKRLGLPVLKKALKKIKKTAPQKRLTRAERDNNLKGCFRAQRSEVEGKTLILVDDVLTTGATADAVCSELYKRGAKKVYLATAASVEYKRKPE